MTKIRIAIAQTAPICAPEGPAKLEKPHSTSPFSTIDQNLADAVGYVERASAEGAEVVIFPEYFLQGIVNECRQYLTFPSEHLLTFFKNLAKKNKISICGTIVHGKREEGFEPFPQVNPFEHITSSSLTNNNKITSSQLEWAKYLEKNPLINEEDSNPILYNIAFFINDNGDLIGEYTKKNLWHPERDYIKAGEEEHKVFETKWGKVGMMICWDMSHPTHAQDLANQGADIIFAPTFWYATDSEPIIHKYQHDPEYEHHMVQSLCFTRSIETETIWVMCNAGGDHLEGFMGGSGVWVPLRGKIASCAIEPKLEIVDVDLSVLKDSREMYKVREDAAKRLAT
ncbi:uncharacterized protein I206_106662 [Kwoniella pini CBS 10737]|uniref:CN hydrolase domain-containing protein n=1 Tax=Kwoniella pini CBS 10737 TaxID=1296096 RepID=A0A1B9HTJ9_9TREE|nr:uncharacterized protein I206_07447 [Kwoniella pini CBS 10737]OCF46594.1 hypothetical protein I206_07447 [Kwoniella pini CBS 10737]